MKTIYGISNALVFVKDLRKTVGAVMCDLWLQSLTVSFLMKSLILSLSGFGNGVILTGGVRFKENLSCTRPDMELLLVWSPVTPAPIAPLVEHTQSVTLRYVLHLCAYTHPINIMR